MKDLSRDDRRKWNSFLNSDSGRKGLAYLESMVPGVYPLPEAHNVILASGVAEGHKLLLSQVRSLANKEEADQSDDIPEQLETTRTR